MTDSAVNYSNSLYELAKEESLTHQMLSDVESVAEILKANPDYIRLLSEPSVSKNDRIRLIDEAFRDSIHIYLLNFLKILCEEGKMAEYAGCARQFRIRFNEDNNISEAVVISAVALSCEQRKALIEKLEKMTGRSILLTQKVDEKFIAGIRVELDGKQYDGTLTGRLDTIRKKVTDIIV